MGSQPTHSAASLSGQDGQTARRDRHLDGAAGDGNCTVFGLCQRDGQLTHNRLTRRGVGGQTGSWSRTVPRPSQYPCKPTKLEPAASTPDGSDVAVEPLGDGLDALAAGDAEDEPSTLNAVVRLSVGAGDRLEYWQVVVGDRERSGQLATHDGLPC